MKWLLILLFLVGCGPRSLDEYRRDGREVTKALIQTLQQVRAPADFGKYEGKIKVEFLNLAEIMIAAREHWLSHSDEDIQEINDEDRALSSQLEFEILRIYEIEGGAAFIASCQLEAASKLNIFEQKLKKRKLGR